MPSCARGSVWTNRDRECFGPRFGAFRFSQKLVLLPIWPRQTKLCYSSLDELATLEADNKRLKRLLAEQLRAQNLWLKKMLKRFDAQSRGRTTGVGERNPLRREFRG